MDIRRATATVVAVFALVAGLAGTTATANAATSDGTRNTGGATGGRTHATSGTFSAPLMPFGDNNSASVGGRDVISYPANGSPSLCPTGAFCMFTQPGFQGTMWAFAHCETYDLYNWNGVGSWANNQYAASGYSSDAHILGANYQVIDVATQYQWIGDPYDWTPAWHVQPCGNW